MALTLKAPAASVQNQCDAPKVAFLKQTFSINWIFTDRSRRGVMPSPPMRVFRVPLP